MQRAIADFPRRVRVGSRTVRIQQRLGDKVKDEASSTVYALKEVLCLHAPALLDAVRKAKTLNKISHQNVIAVKGADQFQDSRGLHMLILTEYCSGGSLNDRLARLSSEEMNMKWICQKAEALARLHSRGVVHRDLKADVLLTATEDVKLADFGLAREYTALKRIDAHREDGSWTASCAQYYMNSGTGPVHWVAPEVFTAHYTEKADVFSLGTLFFAILERDFIVIAGKAIYGAFVDFHGVGKLGLGLAMAKLDSSISIAFSSHAQAPRVLQRVVMEALQYDNKNRPSAEEICNKVTNIRRAIIWIQDHQQEFGFNNSSRSSSSIAATRNSTCSKSSIRYTVSRLSSISSTVDFSNSSRYSDSSDSSSSSSSSSRSSSSTDSSDSADSTSNSRFNSSIRSSNTYSSRSTIRTSQERVVKPTALVKRAIMIKMIRQLLGRRK